jgi:membrane fusion protein
MRAAPLFRPESIVARQTAWLGEPTISLAPPIKFVSMSSCVLVAIMLAMVVFGSYARRENLHGVLLPPSGLVQVSAPQNGVIRSISVVDDQKVHAGDVLYVIDTDTTSSDGATQQKILDALRHQRELLATKIETKEQLRTTKNRDLRDKVNNLRAQIEQSAVQVTVQSSFAEVLQRQYDQYSGFVTKGMSSLNDMQIRQQSWMRAKSELEELKNNKLRLEAQLTESEYRLRSNDPESDAEINAMRSQALDIDQKIANSQASQSIEIHAPSDGSITAIVGHAGQVVVANAPLLTIVPASDLQAQLVAPSSAVGFVAAGERVLLRYDAFPYQKFGQYWGTVTGVSRAGLSEQEVKSLPIEAQKATYYRVAVKPDNAFVNVYGREQPLRASMQVDAYVLLDRRALYEWILEPYYALQRNVQNEAR